MTALPPFPILTRLHRETKGAFVELFKAGHPDASLELARRNVAEKYGHTTWQQLRAAVTQQQNGLPGEPSDAHLQLLIDSGAQEHPHSGGSLFEHLVATRDLLKEWGNPEHLAVAGLFHSIYGTESYKISAVPLERRREVADRIGEQAECLAYVFCVTHRSDFFTQLESATPSLKDLVHNTELPVTVDQLRELIELEVANYVEQIYPERAKPSTVDALKWMLSADQLSISAGARVSLEDLIARCESISTAAAE